MSDLEAVMAWLPPGSLGQTTLDFRDEAWGSGLVHLLLVRSEHDRGALMREARSDALAGSREVSLLAGRIYFGSAPGAGFDGAWES